MYSQGFSFRSEFVSLTHCSHPNLPVIRLFPVKIGVKFHCQYASVKLLIIFLVREERNIVTCRFVYLAEKETLLYDVRERDWLLNEKMNELSLEEERAITAARENETLKAQLEEGKNYKTFESWKGKGSV